MILRSVVLNGMCPEIETDRVSFLRAVSRFQRAGIRSFEYYADKRLVREYGEILRQRELRSVFLAAAAQKRDHQSLCAVSEEERRTAVSACVELAERAASAEADAILITSGWKPAEGREAESYDALRRSLEQLRAAAGKTLEIYIEPGDTAVEYFQLIGTTELACKLASENGISLTMDMSHTAQLGEDPWIAFAAANPYTKHFHLANCVLEKPSTLYGDKHPPFGVKSGTFSSKDAQNLYSCIAQMNPDREVRVGLEIINRTDDPWLEIEKVIQQEKWFFSGPEMEAENL